MEEDLPFPSLLDFCFCFDQMEKTVAIRSSASSKTRHSLFEDILDSFVCKGSICPFIGFLSEKSELVFEVRFENF